MTVLEEVKILQSLKGDTYFAQKFGQDIDQMCENIKNDYPIELGCQFMAKDEALQRQLVAQQEASRAQILSLAYNVIYNIDDSDELYDAVKDCIGIDQIIKYKHSKDIELDDKEIDYLVSKLG